MAGKPWPAPPGKALVVVVNNGLFDGAGYAYSEAEFLAFCPSKTDRRPRTYLFMDENLVKEAINYKER